MTRPPVTISPLQHRGARRIKVECPFDPAVISQIKKVKGRQWSKTHHCWHVPYTTEAFRQLKEMFDVSISPESGVRKQTPHTVKSGLDTTSETILLEKESKYRMKAFVPWQRKDWIDRIKTIPGRAWNEEEKYWSLPLARAVVEDLKTWFGKQLELKFEVPKYLPGNYLPKNWKTTANRVDKENHSTAWPHIAVSQKATHLKTPVPTKHAPVKQRIPAASLNKLNIQPGATPQLQTFMQDGMELIRVMGDSIIICPSGAHFVEAYLPLNKPGWIKDIREIPGRTWSPEAKCWRLPYVVETIKLLYRAFGGKAVFSFRPSDEIPVEWADKKPPGTTSPEPLLPVHKECLIALEKQLMLERKSRSTIRSYKHHLRRFLQHYPGTPPADINEKQIKDYLLYLVNEKSIAESTQNLVINSIKAFYEKVLKQEQKMYYIPRPKKRQTLPGIFSEKEVVNLLDATGNPKHKCILMVIYSAGLRLGELVNLKTRDIDPGRMRIFVHAAKGKKDRYTLLSKKAMLHLERYMRDYRPDDWLFEGQDGGQYSKSSVQKIFKRACRKAGIRKPVTVHSLRHSFATHLHEKGISLRHIQGLLGHESSKTTEIYTHLTRKGFEKLESPLDHLDF